MEILWHCALGFAPGLLWLAYFWRKDAHEPEPRRLLVLVFALGCASAFAVLALRPHLEPLAEAPAPWHALLEAFVVTAASEELLKLTAFLIGAFWLRELDEPMDGIVYGAAAGLGFASIENVMYLRFAGDPTVVVARAFTATLVHAACTGGLGFCAAMFKFTSARTAAAIFATGLVSAIALHGAYDYFLLGRGGHWSLSLLGILPLLLMALALKLRWARARSRVYHA